MRALDRLPRRRTSRAARPMLSLIVAVALGAVVATAVSPEVNADPDPTWFGRRGSKPVDGQRTAYGQSTDEVKAAYWYVDPTAAAAHLR